MLQNQLAVCQVPTTTPRFGTQFTGETEGHRLKECVVQQDRGRPSIPIPWTTEGGEACKAVGAGA